ncbi:hypothetical protein BLA29_006076 [Euroglyphus maynei]|uniref:ABC transmembrane type-1 domain-containing protein n=1 Tax=Euroglyphus maynei TaxID=6958 RepID=A0A1Y3BMW5_EURMA|nr:hypothetical protein BLA29_006076 [Euroglyphus maynei]
MNDDETIDVKKTADADADNEQQKKPLAKMTASFFSRLTFSWYSPLTYLGRKRPIILSDIWRIRKQESSFYNYQLFQKKLDKFREEYEQQQQQQRRNSYNVGADKKPKHRLFKVNIVKIIWSTLKYYFLPGSFAKIVNDFFVFANPMVLK